MNILPIIKKFTNKALDLIYPNDFRCILCGNDLFKDNTYFCNDCQLDDIFNDGNRCVKCDCRIKENNIICDHCKSYRRYFLKCVCPLNYNNRVKSAMVKFKDDNGRYLAQPFSQLVIDRLKQEKFDFDIIVPVPSHPKTIRKRGYNPALILAEIIGKAFKKPVVDVLVKNVLAPKQKFLSYEERQDNLRDSMILFDKRPIKDKKILIVDDVVTTCATINICAGLLVGAKEIYACGVARTNHIS